MPEDLLKFGLIPEFIGRLPIVETLDALDELALRRILVERWCAVPEGYGHGRRRADVHQGSPDRDRHQGPVPQDRRPRPALLEEVMLDVMYDLLSVQGVKKCVVNKEVVEKKEPTTLIFADRHMEQSA